MTEKPRKRISIETAKLLGVMFAWHPMVYIYKYIPTEDGPRLMFYFDKKTGWLEVPPENEGGMFASYVYDGDPYLVEDVDV